MARVTFYDHPTNDAWCRDHGPIFLVREQAGRHERAIVDWGYNAWGGKYPPWDKDRLVSREIARRLGRPGVEIKDIPFSGLFAALFAKQIEFTANPLNITAERAERWTTGWDTLEVFNTRCASAENSRQGKARLMTSLPSTRWSTCARSGTCPSPAATW